jgi:G:T-mismatch repair DNA endonuclease (very short patch repair protein)
MREANRRDDVRQKRSQGLKKMYEAHPEKCEAHALRAKARMEDPDYKRRCTISMIAASRRTGGTSRQEKELASVLSEFGFEHKRDFGDMQVDFYNPETDTAVEYYGTWWHCHQSTIKRITKDYNGVHPVIQKTPNQIMQEDFERVEKLKKFVEHVVIIWEYDVFDGKKFDKQAISNILSSTSGAWR